MSWNVLEGETLDPSTWNWDPQCPPKPEGIKIFINATNITNATFQVVDPGCKGYCAGFLYPLTWQIEEIRESVYPVFLYIFGILYTFFAIAIICDEFFVPALERIADKYDISPDVAGATLMAAGGSAPELATSSIGTFNESPVGFGTLLDPLSSMSYLLSGLALLQHQAHSNLTGGRCSGTPRTTAVRSW